MTRFSLEGDDDRNEQGPSRSSDGEGNLGFSIKRRRLAEGTARGNNVTDDSYAKSEVDHGDEESVTVQPSEPIAEGIRFQPIDSPPHHLVSSAESGSSSRKGSVSLQLTLTDPDVLDCPICFEPLTSPVYQCDNGHLGCASCCAKMNHRCGSCYLPIGYSRCRAIEKVLESIKLSCKNNPRGCTQLLTYSKILDHEKSCEFVPCKCPYPQCTYVDFFKSLYVHFPTRHSRSCRTFLFNSMVSIEYDYFDQNLVFLQERAEKTLFVLNRFYGSVETSFGLYVVCISPDSPDNKFSYHLSVRNEESLVQLKTIVECITDQSLRVRAGKYLLVPDDFLKDLGQLKLELVICRR